MNIDNLFKKIVSPDFNHSVIINSVSYSSLDKTFVTILTTKEKIENIVSFLNAIGLSVLASNYIFRGMDIAIRNKLSYGISADKCDHYLLIIDYSKYDNSAKFENEFNCLSLANIKTHLQELFSNW